jgi:hypothetical protein
VKFIQSSGVSSILDMYDIPVRSFLQEELRNIGYDPVEFGVVIDVALREAKGLVTTHDMIQPSTILRGKISGHALIYLQGILSQSKKFTDTLKRINAYGSVFLVGAGISFESGMPLSDILDDLLRFCKSKNYEDLRKDKSKCLKFKSEFQKLCANKEPGRSHEMLALNFPKNIFEIICLNWDNLIEKGAIKFEKGISKINEDNLPTTKSHLWKFHGDVENIKKDNSRGRGGWIFPDENGYVFDCFKQYVKNNPMLSSIFTFVIVGYSEREEEIYSSIIESFEESPPRPTIRVGLDLSRLKEDFYIVGPSAFVLEKILLTTS